MPRARLTYARPVHLVVFSVVEVVKFVGCIFGVVDYFHSPCCCSPGQQRFGKGTSWGALSEAEKEGSEVSGIGWWQRVP